MEEPFELNDVAQLLVKNGVITIHVTITQTGVDIYARSVMSHPSLDIHPHMSFTLFDLEDAFRNHALLKQHSPQPSSPNKRVLGEKSAAMKLPFRDASSLESGRRSDLSRISVETAKRLVNKAGADMVTRNGVKNFVPKDSLVHEDLRLTTDVLYARMVTVASAIGNVKAIARISTNPELSVAGAVDIDQWWDSASVEQRLTLLSSAKKLNISESLSKLSEQKRLRLSSGGGLRSPFRGSPVKLDSVETSSSGEESNGW